MKWLGKCNSFKIPSPLLREEWIQTGYIQCTALSFSWVKLGFSLNTLHTAYRMPMEYTIYHSMWIKNGSQVKNCKTWPQVSGSDVPSRDGPAQYVFDWPQQCKDLEVLTKQSSVHQSDCEESHSWPFFYSVFYFRVDKHKWLFHVLCRTLT